MELDTSSILPLATLVLGWMLHEVSRSVQINAEYKAALSTALADLLEIRHNVISMQEVTKKVRSVFPGNEEEFSKITLMIRQALPEQEELHKRYENAVTVISKTNPIFAFKLRSKNQINSHLNKLDSLISGEPGASEYLAYAENKATEKMIPALNSTILKLAIKSGSITGIRVFFLLRKPLIKPKEFDEIFNEIMPSSPTSES